MSQEFRIAFNALPHRPHHLSPADISTVYGGCVELGSSCSQEKDCCIVGDKQLRCFEDANPSQSGKRCLW